MSAIVSPRHMAFDRRFHALACTAAFATVFVGFARTYYLEFLFGTPALPWLVHLHGALMTSWFVLFFTQTYLIASHRTHAKHQVRAISDARLMRFQRFRDDLAPAGSV
jgi:hypothetical protein